MKATFNKKEKLKSKKEIELLFSEGKSIVKYPIRLVYRKTSFEDPVPVKAGISVSKRHFKKAVDRNRIKRLLREGYRKNKYLVSHTNDQFTFMLLYTGKELPTYEFIALKVKGVLQAFAKKEIASK